MQLSVVILSKWLSKAVHIYMKLWWGQSGVLWFEQAVISEHAWAESEMFPVYVVEESTIRVVTCAQEGHDGDRWMRSVSVAC